MPHVVDIQRPQGDAFDAWRIATAFPTLKAKSGSFGSYVAANYDELIDHLCRDGQLPAGQFQGAWRAA